MLEDRSGYHLLFPWVSVGLWQKEMGGGISQEWPQIHGHLRTPGVGGGVAEGKDPSGARIVFSLHLPSPMSICLVQETAGLAGGDGEGPGVENGSRWDLLRGRLSSYVWWRGPGEGDGLSEDMA